MTNNAIEVTGLSKAFRLPHQHRTTFREHFLHPFDRTTYDVHQALQDVTFNIVSGEFFGIIGPNGSGKSTLLKLIAGIYKADAGSVRIAGRLSPFIELGVGFNMDLDARDNIRVNAALLGLSKREVEAKFDEIVAFAELERFVDQKLKNYSSGMQMRLAYSIAIQVPFDVLLLDEVLAVGDYSFQQKCFTTFDRFLEEGKTIVFVSHDLAAIRRFCNRALVLSDGVVLGVGPPEELAAAYPPLAAVETAAPRERKLPRQTPARL